MGSPCLIFFAIRSGHPAFRVDEVNYSSTDGSHEILRSPLNEPKNGRRNQNRRLSGLMQPFFGQGFFALPIFNQIIGRS